MIFHSEKKVYMWFFKRVILEKTSYICHILMVNKELYQPLIRKYWEAYVVYSTDIKALVVGVQSDKIPYRN
jgi:hypothetical protein